MKQLISDVIQIDQAAQKEIESLKKEKEELYSSFVEVRKELTQKNNQSIKQEQKKLEETLKLEYQANLDKLIDAHKKMEEKVVKIFKEKEESWLRDLFSICCDVE